ncbi:MAG: ABC transporter ATP-binding protein [bacterium]|nr:ABC transporter ATP-binding protein [bacterium]
MNIPLIYLFRKMWRYAEDNRRNVVLYISMFVLANLISALEPLIVGVFLNAVQSEGVRAENVPHLFLLLCLLPLLEVTFWSLHGPARTIENRNAFIVRANYKNYLLRGVIALPIEWHTDHHSGDTIDKIDKGTEALFGFSERTFEVLQTIIMLIVSFGVLFFYDRVAGIVALTISALTFYIIALFDRKLVPGYKRVNRMGNTISEKVFDVLSNVTTVIILRVESLVLASIDTFIRKPFAQYNINSKLNEWKWFSAAFLGRMAVVVVVGLYLFSRLGTGSILIGTIYILYGYANQIREAFFKFSFLYNDIVRYRTSVSNAEELSENFRDAGVSAGRQLPGEWSVIAVDGLSFSYHAEDGATLHLDNVSLSVRKGERIAFIGESGGGKSTFLKVMRDLYHPRTLALTVDGTPMPEGFLAISDSISLIPQDPEIFATTIRENITLGVDYTDEHVGAFTDMAAFTDVVRRLPKGLESSIVEKGVNLSGGEKQRLALTRGLLASVDKDIVLLDEPTSSVDFHNELQIYENIFSAFPNKTIISSVHRLHLLSLFNSVYFLRDGKIIAAGSFEELKKSSLEFQELWEQYIRTRDASVL